LKRSRKLVSVLLTLALLAAMMVPLAAPAAAATTIQALTVPTMQPNTPAAVTTYGATLGTVLISEVNAGSIDDGDVFDLSLPNTVTAQNLAVNGGPAGLIGDGNPAAPNPDIEVVAAGPTQTVAGVANYPVTISVPANVGGNANAIVPANVTATLNPGRNVINISINDTVGGANALPNIATKSYIMVYLNAYNVGAINGAIDMTMSSPTNTGFSGGTVTVGTTATGSTTSLTPTVKNISSSGTEILDDIIITENVTGTFSVNTGAVQEANYIKIQAPNGFTWQAGAMQNYAWGLSANPAVAPNIGADASGKSCMWIKIPAATNTQTGRVVVAGASLAVDESVAKLGDVTVRVSGGGANNDVTSQDIVVAKYMENSVAVEGKTTVDTLVGGKADQEIGSFYLKEGLAGSLIGGRTILLTLPDGARWNANPNNTVEKGDGAIGAWAAVGTDGRTIKATWTASTTATDILFKNASVDLAPDFKGDLAITVSGTAGAAGEVVVGTAVLPITVEVSAPTEVKLGYQGQALADITIKEINAESFKGAGSNLILRLPDFCVWAGYPTVTVTEGDLVVDTAAMTGNAAQNLTIPIKSSSTTASTIKITNAKATVYRQSPEGPFKVVITNTSNSLVDFAVRAAFPQKTAVTAFDVANVITPGEQEIKAAGVVKFTIGGTDYSVGADTKSMDIAPYIKNGRTFLPVRYVALALGVSDSNILWDGAAQKVTLLKGDKVVQMTIGSKTLVVNGVAINMDAAPEITNGRTMLPFRFIAQALGATVSWDEATQTVTLNI